MMKWTAFLLVTLFSGVLYASESETERLWFVDTNYVYERGSALSSEYIKENAPSFSTASEALMPWIVRIEVRFGFEDGGYKSNHGTGIILEGGKVLTANHVLTQSVEGRIEVILTLTDGRVFPAEVEQQGERDWARLRMEIGAGDEALLDSPVEVADATAGETTVFFGYPARLGLDDSGKVQSFSAGDKEKGVAADQLRPMLIVSEARDLEGMRLDPLAGFPPVGGMSGGPIVNLKGQVVAVQHSVAQTTENETGKVLGYEVLATPISVISQRIKSSEAEADAP